MALTDKNYLEAELETLVQTDPVTWEFLQQGSLDGVWYWDLEQPENEWMSPEFWRLFGIDPSSRQHRAAEWQDLIHQDDLRVALENFRKHCADPAHPYDQIVRYKHAAGGTVWVRCRGMAVRDATGKPVRMLGAHNDLTDLMQAKIALEQASAETRAILDAANSGIAAIGSQGLIKSLNAEASRILCLAPGALPAAWPEHCVFLNRKTLEPLPPEADPVARVLAGGQADGELHVLRRGGVYPDLYVRISSRAAVAGGAQAVTVLALQDETDQERNRQRMERAGRLDALGQMTGGIAHDFNNLLTTILYSLQLALRESPGPRVERHLTRAITSIGRGTELTKRLLAFPMRQPGLAKSHNVAELLTEFQKLIKPSVEEAITLAFTVEDPDLHVFCDAGQLENTLLNLVLNSRDAIQHAATGNRIEVAVRGVETFDVFDPNGQIRPEAAADGEQALRYVEFTVTDNGPGMSAEVKQRALDPFFTTKDVNSGTGLGLSMVYGFVQQSEGDLRLYSEQGVGTTVRIVLPRGEADGQREGPVDREPAPTGSGERILLVEDEEGLREAMSEFLSDLGYRVSAAASGAEALERLSRGLACELLLTDVVMPGGVDGFQLAQAAAERVPGVPVIYMSGYTGFSNAEMGDVQGPLLQKPCDPLELAEVVELALQR
ncbi:PAS domain-containing protein [Roseobacteraceae bacterium NS-SX3]